MALTRHLPEPCVSLCTKAFLNASRIDGAGLHLEGACTPLLYLPSIRLKPLVSATTSHRRTWWTFLTLIAVSHPKEYLHWYAPPAAHIDMACAERVPQMSTVCTDHSTTERAEAGQPGWQFRGSNQVRL